MTEVQKLTRIPIIQKAAFGSGHLVNNLFPGALGVFSFFLMTTFGMDPFLAGLLGGIPRIYDAITDPIMGYISDNTTSRWGRRRPYIFIGAITSGLLFACLWQLYADNSQSYNFWYFMVFSLLFLTGNTIYSTPLIGLGYEMTSDYKERTRLMGFSQTISQLAWMIVPWLWVMIADPDLYSNQAIAVRNLSIWVGLSCLILGIIPAIFCREINQDAITNRDTITLRNLIRNMKGLWTNMKLIFKNVPFVKLCMATFLVFNGFQMVASFSFFIIVYYLFNGSFENAGNWPAWFSTIGAMATAFLIIPIITWMSHKWGKRTAFILSTGISIIGYVLKWWGFNPDNLWLMFLPIPFLSFGLGGLFTLMMSMTADVCDLDELHNGMPRKEGTFGAIYWWMVKLGQGLALVLGGLVLKVIGFEGGAAIQTPETIVNLRLADIIIPSLTAGLAIIVMWNYDLNEEKARNIKAELVKRRGEL
ncbi:MAG: MFS transporter [Ignavibacteria bacterium]|nr:MFS transporter [Ignavibacteria bacterium]MBM4173616.1 MFS transporter [Ignavibacteria bacterium]